MAVNVDISLNLEGTERSEALLKRMTATLEVQRKELETLNRVGRLQGLEQGEKEVGALTRRLAGMINEIKRGSDESDELVRNLRDVANAASLVEDKADGAARAIQRIPGNVSASRTPSPDLGDASGRIASGFSIASGGIGDLGLGDEDVSRLFLAGAAIADFAEQGPLIAQSFATMAANAAPLIAGLAVAGGAFVLMKSQVSEAQEELRATIKAEDDRIASLQRQRDFLKNLTLEENRTRLDEIDTQTAEIEASRDALVQAYADAFQDSNAFTSLNQIAKSAEDVGGLTGASFALIDGILSDSLDDVEETRRKIEEYNTQLEALSAERGDLTAVTPERADLEAAQQFIQYLDNYADKQKQLNGLIEEGSKAVNEEIRSLEEQKAAREANIRDALEARQAFEEDSEAYNALTTYIEENQAAVGVLTDNLGVLRNTALPAAQAVDEQARATERAKAQAEAAAKAFDEAAAAFEKADSELKDSVQARIKAQADVVKAENAIADVQAKRIEDDARNTERAAAEKNILDQIEAAKRVSAAAKLNDSLGKIRDDGYRKELDITAKFLNDSAKALNDYNAQVRDLNDKFATGDLRATEDYNLARFRLARDLESDLFDAARNNDVSAFLSARRRGSAQIGDLDTDFGIDRRRAGEDRDANLTALRESYEAEQAERRNAAQQSIAQTRAEVQERLATEQAGAVQRITQEQLLQQQLTDLRTMYAQEDVLRRRAEEDMRLRDAVANARIRMGLAQQTERLLADQAAIAGRNAGIMLINGFVNGVSQYQNAVAAAGFGAAGSIFQNFSFGNINVGNGMTPAQVRDEVRTGVQAGIDQMGKRGGTVFRTRE